MGALELFEARKQAAEMRAHGAPVWMPPEPDFNDVIDEFADMLLDEACDPEKAQELADDWELITNHQDELIRLVAECFHARKTWAMDDRAALYTALGRDVFQLVREQIRDVAKYQLENDKC